MTKLIEKKIKLEIPLLNLISQINKYIITFFLISVPLESYALSSKTIKIALLNFTHLHCQSVTCGDAENETEGFINKLILDRLTNNLWTHNIEIIHINNSGLNDTRNENKSSTMVDGDLKYYDKVDHLVQSLDVDLAIWGVINNTLPSVLSVDAHVQFSKARWYENFLEIPINTVNGKTLSLTTNTNSRKAMIAAVQFHRGKTDLTQAKELTLKLSEVIEKSVLLLSGKTNDLSVLNGKFTFDPFFLHLLEQIIAINYLTNGDSEGAYKFLNGQLSARHNEQDYSEAFYILADAISLSNNNLFTEEAALKLGKRFAYISMSHPRDLLILDNIQTLYSYGGSDKHNIAQQIASDIRNKNGCTQTSLAQNKKDLDGVKSIIDKINSSLPETPLLAKENWKIKHCSENNDQLTNLEWLLAKYKNYNFCSSTKLISYNLKLQEQLKSTRMTNNKNCNH